MTSQARIDANRANAARSTGPKSEAGKARSKLNARRHGLDIPLSTLPELRARSAQIAEMFAGSLGEGRSAPAAAAAAAAAPLAPLAALAALAHLQVLRVEAQRREVLSQNVETILARLVALGGVEADVAELALALGLAQAAPGLLTLERHRRRALSRQRRGLQALLSTGAEDAGGAKGARRPV